MRILKILIFFFSIVPYHAFSQCAGTISTFPYRESFESGQGNWSSGGVNNDWSWGSPVKPTINSAGDGSKCWIVGGLSSASYNGSERSWVESPCLDFTNLPKPYISFWIFWETEYSYDGGNLEYSTDMGQSWQTVGNYSDPASCGDQNWYNIGGVTNLNGLSNRTYGWSGTLQASSGSCRGGHGSGGWVRASKCISNLGGQPFVKFRFTFGSGTTCNAYDGLAFDDFTIGEGPSFPADFTFNCIDSNKVQFTVAAPGCGDKWSWSFSDAGNPEVLTTSSAIHTFSSPGLYNVTMNTGGKCSRDTFISKQVTIISTTVETTDISCNGDSTGTAIVSVNNTNPASFVWQGFPASTSNQLSGLTVGNYQVQISQTGVCSVVKSFILIYGSDAFPSVSLGADTVVCPGSYLLLNPGRYARYFWNDGSADSVLLVKQGGNFSVTVINDVGCKATDSVFVLEDCIDDVIIPNAFTPNNDNVNDIFYVSGSIANKFNFYIFNCWGNQIYYSEDQNVGWTGICSDKLVQPGIYVYKLIYKIRGLAEKVRTGSIAVIY